MQFNAVLVKLLDELEVRLRAAQLWQGEARYQAVLAVIQQIDKVCQ
ncbi:hypothetical protein [Vibrio cholerae]|nr:hypothetical protein [Vibrio cholerae]